MTQIDIRSVSNSSIEARSSELSTAILHTPTVPLQSPLIFQKIKGCRVHLKLECLQHTGTFKARGALSVAHQIPQHKRHLGITAASAGNHAIAAAWAAQQLGLSAKVVMQSSANPFRIARARIKPRLFSSQLALQLLAKPNDWFKKRGAHSFTPLKASTQRLAPQVSGWSF